MDRSFSRITFLEYRLKAAEAEVSAFKSGKKYQKIHEVHRKEVKALEMESFALFANAKALGKKGACLVTITDNKRTGEFLTPEQRKTHLGNMFTLALESAIRM